MHFARFYVQFICFMHFFHEANTFGLKTKTRRVCSFRNGVILGFGDDFWWHPKVPTMVPHLGTGSWLDKHTKKHNKCIKKGSGSIILGIHITEHDETHMPQATGPYPWPRNNINNSFMGIWQIIGQMLILII